MTSEHDRRLAALRARLRDGGLAAAVLASPEAIYYLTGFDHLGYFAFTALVIPPGEPPVVITRAMERPIVRAQLPHCEHRPFGDGEEPADVLVKVLAEVVPEDCAAGIESRAMFFPPAVCASVLSARPDVEWQDIGGLLGQAMAVKAPAELELMHRASAVSDAAMAAGIAAAGPGVAEARVAAEIHHAMFAAGGQQPGFDPLLRPLSLLAQEHVSWNPERVLEPGGVFVELSGCVRRYHAPQSRTVYIGHPPPDAADAHAAALAGLTAAREALRPGVQAGAVYAAWRAAADVSTDRHHCGYQVGIGFPPSWSGGQPLGLRPDGVQELRAGMTFHLMSWVPGHTMSETVVITDDGAQPLTTTTRDLLVVGR